MDPGRRRLLAGGGALAAVAGLLGAFAALRPSAAAPMLVYKSPSCGCCGAWVDHLRANGFAVSVEETDHLGPVKRRFGVPPALESCHTGHIDGYAIEGHVPAAEVRRLLAERPAGLGLAVPGMPIGSPGMETGGPAERYEVILFADDGSRRIYARY